MRAELHVLTGDRTGLVMALSGSECTLGRHPECTLCFGADAEHGVSARHARLVRTPSGWVLQDLGSTNHTWLNGRRLHAPALLRDADRIILGAGGPTLEVRIAVRPSAHGRGRTPQRRGMRCVAVVAAVCIAGIATTFHLERADDVHRGAPTASPATVPGLREREMRGTRAAPPDTAAPHPRSSTKRPAAGAPASPGAPVAAPAPPFVRRQPDLPRANRLAVARIWVESDDGKVSSGTAFSVRANGLLATSRHVVRNQGGPRRMAVQFAGSTQVWRARLVAVSGEWDLALVKVDDIIGAVPVVRGLNLRPDTLAPGSPVSLLGFPRGEKTTGAPARPVHSTATFATARGCCVQVYARSAAGASGSPLFDAEGNLLGVLFGGDPGKPRPVLYAVPAAAVARLMEDAP